MRRTILLACGALFVLSTLAVVVHEPSEPAESQVTLGGGDPDDSAVDEETTTTTSTSTTSTTVPTAPVETTTTTAKARVTTTTTLPPIRYPSGPASPIEQDKGYVVALSDGVPHRVYQELLDQPRWSADGRRLLFAGRSITSVNPDGSEPKNHSLPGAIVTPAWSVKGQLAAVVIEQGATYHLSISQASGVKTVKQSEVGPVSGQAWSPDGSRVAFTAGGRVWTASSSGADVKAVTPAGGKAWRYLSWSPDGRRIAFYEAAAIKVVNADGTGLVTVAPAEQGIPSWSPDGTRLAFTGPRDADGPLSVVSSAGGPVQVLGPTKAFSVSWSPNGHVIAYSDGHAIHVVTPSGTDRRVLVQGPQDVWFGLGIAWSPDSSHVLVNTGGGGEGGPSEPL